MKAIDLYKMVAVDKAPVKIKYLDRYYEYHKSVHDYYYSGEGWLFDNLDELNEEVEIIEDTPKEEKKIPEKLIPTSLRGIDNLDEKIDVAHIDTISAIETINEIIDYLKSKGEKNEIIDKMKGGE